MKIVWRVQEPPTGKYRSFDRRGWPVATLNNANGPMIAALYCETEYTPQQVKAGDHEEIIVKVADHRTAPAWKWRTLRKRAKTLAEAKTLVKEFYTRRQDWLPV